MGFSVSASAAIIFISFLIAAGTLYTAWDNAFTNVQAAQEDWYNLRLSQLNTLVDLNASLGTARIGADSYNVTLHIQSSGVTLYAPHWDAVYDGSYVTIYNVSDDNVGFIYNYTYVLPREVLMLNITNIPLDNTQHNLSIIVDNGCTLMVSWYYNGSTVLISSRGRQCPTEVS